MAAKKKRPAARKKAPRAKKKSASRKAGASIKRPAARRTPRQLPNDEAWRELIATAVEKPDPVKQKTGTAGRKK